jgi:endonuclease-3 related protein
MSKIFDIYQTLYNAYGAQGWWPFINYEGDGYHPLKYTFPRDENEIFEVCLGSILTQNTTFTSVVKSLHNLNNMKCLNYKAIKNMPVNELKLAIKPSGYYNQKANYILEFIIFFEDLNGKIPSRDDLMQVRGIGEETADSILLFAYNQPHFKVDAYTKRLLSHLNFIQENAKYKEIKDFIEYELKKIIKDESELVIVYQEFHALIVKHAKQFYSKKPYGRGCFLENKTS